jgi:carboxypeptidase C (cathepsin A)
MAASPTATHASDPNRRHEPQTPCSNSISDPVSFSAELSGDFNGETIRYRAIASETFIRDKKGTPMASFFSVAYLSADAEAPSSRPVTFVFNGGPGSSAQWLHMGALGPKRVAIPDEPNNIGAPPYSIVENAFSILDVSDLVFIDPIGTGYSRTLGAEDPKHYWGLLEDARSIADFIQTWITHNRRWNSAKYLAAESYGTVRACLLAEILSDRYISLNGIVLIAAVLDYQNSRPRPGDGGILSYASFLPTYAATAWYHQRVSREGKSLGSFLTEVCSFARREYAQALIANYHRLDTQERAAITARLATYTGLSESYIAQSKLRIPVNRFFKELLRDKGLVIGRLDGRYTAVEPESAGESAESDPTFDAIGGAFTSAIHAQLNDLGVRMEQPYLSMADIDSSWNWLLQDRPLSGGSYINVVPHLGRAMRRNKDLRTLVASGYYDLATPYFGAENALSQDGVPHERIAFTYYEVGHMIFLHGPSRERLLADVRKFIQMGNTENNSSAPTGLKGKRPLPA